MKTKYDIELLCDYPGWWRYNVFIMATGVEDGGRTEFYNLVDRVYDPAYGGELRRAPGESPSPREIRLTTGECAELEIYLYVVPNTFPDSAKIADSPPFDLTLRVSAGGRVVEQTVLSVNQWGGLTLAAHRVDPQG